MFNTFDCLSAHIQKIKKPSPSKFILNSERLVNQLLVGDALYYKGIRTKIVWTGKKNSIKLNLCREVYYAIISYQKKSHRNGHRNSHFIIITQGWPWTNMTLNRYLKISTYYIWLERYFNQLFLRTNGPKMDRFLFSRSPSIVMTSSISDSFFFCLKSNLLYIIGYHWKGSLMFKVPHQHQSHSITGMEEKPSLHFLLDLVVFLTVFNLTFGSKSDVIRFYYIFTKCIDCLFYFLETRC